MDPEVTEVVSAEVVEEPRHIPLRVRPKGGRPKGRANNITVEIRKLAQGLVSDPIYLNRLKHDLRKRKVHPQVEVTLLAYAFGKPVDRVEIGRVGDFSRLSDDELMAQFEATVAMLRGTEGGRRRSA